MNTLFVNKAQAVPLFPVSDMAAGAITGDFINLKNYEKVTILWSKESGGTAGDDPTFVLLQAQSDGGGTKALIPSAVHKKQAATNLAAVAQWSDASADLGGAGGNEITDADLAEQEALYAIEFRAEDLDVANDYDWFTCTIADVGSGNAQFASCVAILEGARYGSKGPNMPGAIA